MGGYGDYGFKGYSSKKGKNWKNRRNSGIYSSSNTDNQFTFVNDKASYLELMEESGSIGKFTGLIPYSFIPKEARVETADIDDYFAIKSLDVLNQSLYYQMNIPAMTNFDFVATNMVKLNPDMYNNINYSQDFYNTVLTTDNITKGFLNSVILTFSFSYILPKYLFNLQIYNDLVTAIFNERVFKSRAIILKTDIANHRILFTVSNITENRDALYKYKDLYEMEMGKKYRGEDLIFTKNGNASFDRLNDTLNAIVYHYINDFIMIRKVNPNIQ